jgi:hypothetical protein
VFFFFASLFPTDQLCKVFESLYEHEIIYEATFTKWREDTDDSVPGKKECLFAVHKWLTWLEEAEEESESE